MEVNTRRYSLLIVSILLVHLQSYCQTINTSAGNGTNGSSGDGGMALFAQLSMTDGVAVDASGNVYISDQFNNRIRKINSSGIITTIAGTGTYGYSGDGAAATLATIASPLDLEVDASGNIYFCDYNNSRIRKISNTGIITTIAGTGVPGFSGDGGLAVNANLNLPEGIALDAIGNIYIADRGNNRIRKINTSGIITTIAGTGVSGFSGDGGAATSSQINYAVDVEVDGTGNIYICDAGNNRIRKINTSNIITTFAGTGVAGYSGDGGNATSANINTPEGVAINSAGEVIFADRNNNRIRKINNSGIITTVAGTGVAGFSGDGGAAILAKLDFPRRVAINANGKIFICDGNNYRIRSISNCSNTTATINITACNSYTSPSGNSTWTTSGTYNDVIPNVSGCDSVITINLIINTTNAPTGTATQSFCNSATVSNLSATGTAIQWYAAASGGSPLIGSTALVNGSTYYASQTVSGCESSSRLAVTVTINTTPSAPVAVNWPLDFCYNPAGQQFNVSSVGGATSYVWSTPSGATGSSTGTTINLLFSTNFQSGNIAVQAQNNCGLSPTTVLTVNQHLATSSTLNVTACNSYVFNGQTYTQSGTYNYQGSTIWGCDSMVMLNLTIFPVFTQNVSDETCGSYTWNGQSIFTSGIYTDTLQTLNGCDSIVTLNLTIHPITSITLDSAVVDSFSWNGMVYTSSGTYTQFFTSAFGCDSTVTINLTVSQSGLSEEVKQFSIYPNPAADHIIINTDLSLIGKTYSVFDQVGKVVYKGSIDKASHSLSVTNFSNGVYTLQIDGQGRKTFVVRKE
jgi:sugar lactone lactonase YvrE